MYLYRFIRVSTPGNTQAQGPRKGWSECDRAGGCGRTPWTGLSEQRKSQTRLQVPGRPPAGTRGGGASAKGVKCWLAAMHGRGDTAGAGSAAALRPMAAPRGLHVLSAKATVRPPLASATAFSAGAGGQGRLPAGATGSGASGRLQKTPGSRAVPGSRARGQQEATPKCPCLPRPWPGMHGLKVPVTQRTAAGPGPARREGLQVTGKGPEESEDSLGGRPAQGCGRAAARAAAGRAEGTAEMGRPRAQLGKVFGNSSEGSPRRAAREVSTSGGVGLCHSVDSCVLWPRRPLYKTEYNNVKKTKPNRASELKKQKRTSENSGGRRARRRPENRWVEQDHGTRRVTHAQARFVKKSHKNQQQTYPRGREDSGGTDCA